MFRSHLIKPSLLTIQSRPEMQTTEPTLHPPPLPIYTNYIAYPLHVQYVLLTKANSKRTSPRNIHTAHSSPEQNRVHHTHDCAEKHRQFAVDSSGFNNYNNKNRKPNPEHRHHSWMSANKLIVGSWTDIAIGGSQKTIYTDSNTHSSTTIAVHKSVNG